MKDEHLRELRILGEHESGVRRLVDESHGKPYHALGSLEEAQAEPDGVVILHGDWGGQIYVVCPARLVQCSADSLRSLLLDLDAICWHTQSPEGAGLFYERRSVGAGVPGGRGGGRVLPDVWLHDDLIELGLEPAVRAVITGARVSIADPDHLWADAIEIRVPFWYPQTWNYPDTFQFRERPPWEYRGVVGKHLPTNGLLLDMESLASSWLRRRFPVDRRHPINQLQILAKYEQPYIHISPQTKSKPQHSRSSVRYRFLINIMLANQLAAAAETFDLVTCMQTPVVVEEVVRVLRPGGIFITQQVGDHNAENLLAGWGWDSYAGWRHYFWQNQGYPEEWQDLQHLSERFQQLGCVVVRRMEYDVPYYFRDIRALVFWLEAIPPGDRFSPAEYERQIEEIVNAYTRPRGIETNEHRELLIVQKQGSSIGPTGKGQLRERDQRV